MAKSAPRKKVSLPRYDERRGWTGGDSRTLYAFTDRRTGSVDVHPGGGAGQKLLMHSGPELTVRVASRPEAEELWQSPLSAGWKVAEAGNTSHATRKYGPKASEKIGKTMHEFKRGKLKSSSGQKVKSREQAIAIGISQARRSGYKVPPDPSPSHATRKSPAQLDKEIAEFIANPKLGEPKWERDYSELLTEKHSKARMPTVDELARALSYVEREYVIKDDRVDMEQLAEGLAFGRYAGDAEDKRRAKELLDQVSAATWLRTAERANHLAREQDEAPRYV